jgi:hypothetical protein
VEEGTGRPPALTTERAYKDPVYFCLGINVLPSLEAGYLSLSSTNDNSHLHIASSFLQCVPCIKFLQPMPPSWDLLELSGHSFSVFHPGSSPVFSLTPLVLTFSHFPQGHNSLTHPTDYLTADGLQICGLTADSHAPPGSLGDHSTHCPPKQLFLGGSPNQKKTPLLPSS